MEFAEDPYGGCVMGEGDVTENNICRKVARIYEGRDWHKLSITERILVDDLVKLKFLDVNKPANGFVGKIIDSLA